MNIKHIGLMSANTVREAGIEPLMATAVAAKHQWMADQARGWRVCRP
ncbi:hypothetical protein [Polaromonas sp. CG9_12]|nr:hypothetical protein [Polaromonas sp. CG9_12]